MNSKIRLLSMSVSLSAALFVLTASPSVLAADAVAPIATVDKAFVGKVSQGGRFEVEASQSAQAKASAQDVKDFAAKDVSDHDQVNAELKSIATAQSLPLSRKLNKKLQKKLDKLNALSGSAFDKAYVTAMAKIHQKDEAIFAQEAQAGASADWKAFAAKTDAIVKAHIVALNAIQTKQK